MNSRDIQNLSEAYLRIYEEKKTVEQIKAEINKREADSKKRKAERGLTGVARNPRKYHYTWKNLTPAERHEKEKSKRKSNMYSLSMHRTTGSRGYDAPMREELIISYLIDEGYASSLESAEAIYENMSEGWKTDVIKATKKIAKKVGKTKFAKKAKKFVTRTALGAIGVPLIS